jgi:NTP pyrophosphatase (non-canonical NTP hydrolase)
VRELQLMAERVYGRLEAERAVAWTIEELGELAQVMRRDEGAGRVLEELGQLFCWMLCLANITGCDLGRGAQLAKQREVERQVAKYGALRPYDPETTRAA